MPIEARDRDMKTSAVASQEKEHFRLLYKIALIKSLCEKYQVSGPLLDIGCRYCDYLEALRPLFDSSVGVDFQRGFIEARKSTVNVVNAAGESLPIRKESCGMVLLLETIEHVSDPGRVLEEIQKILAPSGYLFLTAPNRFYPFEIHGIGKRNFSPFFGIPLLSWAPDSLRKYLQNARIYTQKDLVHLCEQNGLMVTEIAYMPPQFDSMGNGRISNSTRIVVNRLGEWVPMKQMGASCMVFARKMQLPKA
jgi:SAM-dependent methyltransferase